MAYSVSHKCPSCGRVFSQQKESYGPPIIQCRGCNTLIKTGWHRIPTFWDKVEALYSTFLGLGLFLVFFIITYGKEFGLNHFMFYGVSIFVMYVGIHNFRVILDYEKSELCKSSEIPRM